MNIAIAPNTFAPNPHPLSLEIPTLLNLLIVDDDRFARETCREAAATLGYRASTVESAEQVSRLIDSQAIDVVLLDLEMPGVGRLKVLRQIKERRPDIEVIVVSGNGPADAAVEAMKNGAYDHLAKPFGLQE